MVNVEQNYSSLVLVKTDEEEVHAKILNYEE